MGEEATIFWARPGTAGISDRSRRAGRQRRPLQHRVRADHLPSCRLACPTPARRRDNAVTLYVGDVVVKTDFAGIQARVWFSSNVGFPTVSAREHSAAGHGGWCAVTAGSRDVGARFCDHWRGSTYIPPTTYYPILSSHPVFTSFPPSSGGGGGRATPDERPSCPGSCNSHRSRRLCIATESRCGRRTGSVR